MELLIAVFITALILGIIYASYFNVVNTMEQLQKKLKPYKLARIIFYKMKQDVDNIYPSFGREEGFFYGLKNNLKFVSTNCLYNNQTTGLYFIEYFTIAWGEKFNLCRKENNLTLCWGRDFKDLRFYYYDGQRWIDEWDSRWMGRLPEGIKVTISIDSEGKIYDFSSLLVVPVAK